jgi:hypothetical protein
MRMILGVYHFLRVFVLVLLYIEQALEVAKSVVCLPFGELRCNDTTLAADVHTTAIEQKLFRYLFATRLITDIGSYNKVLKFGISYQRSSIQEVI